MHVCLLIDVLTALALLHGLKYSDTALRKLLCLASLIYLGCIGIHYYTLFAGYFGIFQSHPSLATRARAEFLKFFGGLLTFFGVMVLAKGVSWVALAFAIYGLVRWFTKSRAISVHTQSF